MADMEQEPNCQRYSDGHKEWRFNGRLHRNGGPAVIYPNGTESWYQHGIHHREDGPAITWLNGTSEWWFNDYVYSFNDWCKKVKLSPEKIIELKLVYG